MFFKWDYFVPLDMKLSTLLLQKMAGTPFYIEVGDLIMEI